MNYPEISSVLREFMTSHLEGRTLEDEDDIFSLGFANSLFALELVAFAEQRFSIEVGSEDLDIENFRSIKAIAGLVQRKRAVECT